MRRKATLTPFRAPSGPGSLSLGVDEAPDLAPVQQLLSLTVAARGFLERLGRALGGFT